MRPPWEELEPASQGVVERRRQTVRHLAQFTGVVFAATIALVTLHIINHLIPVLSPDGSLIQVVRETRPALTTSVLSFLVLLTCWLLYHLQFHYLTRPNGTLLLLHVFLLPCVILLAVSTTLLSTMGLTRDVVALYAGNVLAIQLLLLLTWRHAVKGGLLFGSDVPSRMVVRLRFMLHVGTVATAITLGLAFLSPAMSLGVLGTLFIVHLSLIAKGGYSLDFRQDSGRMTDT